MRETFKVSIRFKIEKEDGTPKTIRESFLYEAVNFSDAERLVTLKIEEEKLNEAFIESIRRLDYFDIIRPEGEGLFFETTVKETFEDEKGKEIIESINFLIYAKTVGAVEKEVEVIYTKTTIPYEIKSVKDSKLKEVILF